MQRRLPYFLFLVLTLSFGQKGSAQDKSTPPMKNAFTASQDSVNVNTELFWASVGAGIYGPGFGGIFKATYSWGNNNISAKYAAGTPLNLGSDGGTDELIREFGLFYGKQRFSTGMLGRLAAGISYVPEARINGKDKKGFGIGGEAEIIFKSSAVGIGFMASTVIVPGQLWAWGLTLNIHLGKLQKNSDPE